VRRRAPTGQGGSGGRCGIAARPTPHVMKSVSAIASFVAVVNVTRSTYVDPQDHPFEVADPNQCHGEQTEYTACPDNPACAGHCLPSDCTFSAWTAWESVGTCTGLCSRAREIQAPNNQCGRPCVGGFKETKACLNDQDWLSCASKASVTEACELSDWTEWNVCSGSVTGQTYRNREVITNHDCSMESLERGPLKQTKMCGETNAKDCLLGEWEDWSACTAQCKGRAARLRKVIAQAEHGGLPCDAVIWQNKPCGEENCGGDANCELNSWSEWSQCSAFSQQFRERDVIAASRGSGRRCDSHLKETKDCGAPVTVTDCTLSEWGIWDECDRTCGGGQQYRLRTVQHEAHNCGKCPEATTKQSRPCSTNSCFIANAISDCLLNAWGDWSECSSNCGNGVRFRDRTVKQEAGEGGRACAGDLKNAEGCQSAVCAEQDCVWGAWEDWSTCSRTCGGGQKHRGRQIVTPPRFGGTTCSAKIKDQIGACSTQSCDNLCTDGKWGEWTEWNACSVTCDEGYRQRSREMLRSQAIAESLRLDRQRNMKNVQQIHNALRLRIARCPHGRNGLSAAVLASASATAIDTFSSS
jgi:hypothetical protein